MACRSKYHRSSTANIKNRVDAVIYGSKFCQFSEEPTDQTCLGNREARSSMTGKFSVARKISREQSRERQTQRKRERVRGTRGTINPFKLQRRPSISLQLFPWTGTSLSFASLPPTFPISNLELQFLNQLKFVCFTGGCDRLLKYQVVKCRMKIWLFNFIIIINVIYRNILYNEKPMWPMKGMTTNV